ncbi:hypothetical protein HDZ31DRAFT_68574 [Schizophyllum fasciatum]
MAPPKLYTRRSAMRASQASVQLQVGDKDLKAAAKTSIQPAPQTNGKSSSRQADVKPAKRASEEVQQAVDTTATMRAKKKRRIEVEVVSEGSPSPVATPAPAGAVQTKGEPPAQASSTSRVANSRRGDGATATPTVHTSETQGKKAALSIQKVPGGNLLVERFREDSRERRAQGCDRQTIISSAQNAHLATRTHANVCHPSQGPQPLEGISVLNADPHEGKQAVSDGRRYATQAC